MPWFRRKPQPEPDWLPLPYDEHMKLHARPAAATPHEWHVELEPEDEVGLAR